MDATTTDQTTLLIKNWKNSSAYNSSFDTLTFVAGDDFSWNHTSQCITYDTSSPYVAALMLHELGHANLHHTEYHSDVELLSMETAAWDEAKRLAKIIHININESLIDSSLDSYRDWLHSRSLCPACSATGVQQSNWVYRCVACSTSWRVNEARSCSLRRYTIKKHSR